MVRRVQPQSNETGKLQVLSSMQDTARRPGWEPAGIHGMAAGAAGAAAPPCPSPPGATQAVTAACHRRGAGWQGSAAVSPVRDAPEVAVTLLPLGFPLPGSAAGTADPIKRGC